MTGDTTAKSGGGAAKYAITKSSPIITVQSEAEAGDYVNIQCTDSLTSGFSIEAADGVSIPWKEGNVTRVAGTVGYFIMPKANVQVSI